ncbi:DNA topoisomerase III [Thiorhodococcus mannitoliphagus]|uniref:DNA topoisomerase n=1 Tax=Thiorhodococcus mannitoliphagus TaxID=329406 RepID=A0A6P1E6J7_9GAMM|nr:type IA DNA topoisomerase [Thiorhodococcus mannitoliphagus]NEX23185.1 DNA topoisomerase III [Thiorhodococcus mannitoliphagus]
MTTVVLAEKPSVARDLARVLGAGRKGEGYLEGNGYRVTWALGHLIHLAEPDEYGDAWAGRWSAEPLPMIPERWKLRIGKQTAKQFKIVKALITAPETERLICATDAGREGEHIFRLIYEHARCKKPFERLWISSLTDEAIRAGFRALKPGHAFNPLADAARARAQADWLVGMNLTRAYTVHNRVLCTIGRVQTPTLAMIVARDAEIANFTKAFFYELAAHLTEGFVALYLQDGTTRIERKETAERLQRELSPHQTGTVSKVEKKVRHHRPPPLYDLTNLQRDANRRFGFTAAQVLEHAQALYETHKLISYPRTESRHISEDMLPQLPGILKQLQHPLAPEALHRLESGHRLNKAYVDRTKLTDHHAILPTGTAPSAALPPPLRRIYDLVVARFVAIFLPDQRVEETRVEIAIGEATFLARGSVVLEPGWKRVEPERRQTKAAETAEDGDDNAPQGPLPSLDVGQRVHVDRLEVREKETQPPRHYDDASLLAAMKNAGRTIEDDALASAMAASGLGTPATRAEILEKLIRTGYLERQRKQLRATAKGQALIGLVAAPLRSPELTAEWEQRLKEIELGERTAAEFDRDIVTFLRELVPQIAQGPALSAEQVDAARQGEPRRNGGKAAKTVKTSRRASGAKAAEYGPCPLCKQGEITETTKALGCSRYRDGCGFTIWKTVAGRKLTKTQIRQLIDRGRTDPIQGFVSKAGKPFAAALRLDPAGKVMLDFGDAAKGRSAAPRNARASSGSTPLASDKRVEAPPQEPASSHAPSLREDPPLCPKCGQGRIIEGRRGFGCNRYRDGCNFVVWKQIDALVLTEGQIRALIEHGRAGPIAATDAHGPVYLQLDAHWQVRVERT